MRDWRIYPKAFRDPTMKDVVEQAKAIDAAFWCERVVYLHVGRVRKYYVQRVGRDPELLEEVHKGDRPDWRAMLKQLGSNWA